MCEEKSVLVTGANGYIGSHVVKFLLDQGRKVIACDLRNDNVDLRAHFIKLDVLLLSEKKDLYEDLGKPNVVIHLAWQDGFNHYADSHMENLMSHFKFLKNIIDGGCQSVAVMGTAHEIGYHEGKISEDTPCNPLSYYGIAKNTLRQLMFVYVKDKRVSFKWLRAFYITGDDYNNHSVFTKLLELNRQGQKEFPFTKGTNQFDFIDVRDLAKQISVASVQEDVNGIINVCSGEPVSLKDKVEEFIKEKKLKIKLKYGVFPPRQYDSPVVYGDNKKISLILKDHDNV